MAPAPSCTSKIQGGVWDLTLSGVRQCTGDYGLFVLGGLFDIVISIFCEHRMESLAWVSWDHRGYREISVGCTEQRPVLLVVLNSFFLRP